jgi:hypothetical protein
VIVRIITYEKEHTSDKLRHHCRVCPILAPFARVGTMPQRVLSEDIFPSRIGACDELENACPSLHHACQLDLRSRRPNFQQQFTELCRSVCEIRRQLALVPEIDTVRDHDAAGQRWA